MSKQEMAAYGKQEFRKFPLVTLDLPPDLTDMGDHYRRAAGGELGVRIKNLQKPLMCGKTAKQYQFWDNLIYHYKNLYPMYDKKVDFKQYTSVHDGWLFTMPQNLKLHNKICKFEQAQATEVEKRVNLENPDWEPPCNRRDERYMEDDPDTPAAPGVKKSRFLRKARKQELAYKENKEEAAPAAPVRRRRKPLPELPEVAGPPRAEQEKVVERNRHGVTVVHFPHDPDDLDPIPRPPVKNVPEYYGWTHSENADSWYLEAHTPSMYEKYEQFYDEALKKRVICPKFYSCV